MACRFGVSEPRCEVRAQCFWLFISAFLQPRHLLQPIRPLVAVLVLEAHFTAVDCEREVSQPAGHGLRPIAEHAFLEPPLRVHGRPDGFEGLLCLLLVELELVRHLLHHLDAGDVLHDIVANGPRFAGLRLLC